MESAKAATYTVTTTNDNGAGSLRQAITNANNTGTVDTITFNISGNGPHSIDPATALPTITDSGLTIDGTTQGSGGGATVCNGTANGTGGMTGRKLRIVVYGDSHSADVMTVSNASNVTIKGIVFADGTSDGLYASNADGLTLLCNHFGASTDTSFDTGNAATGATLTDSTNAVIGDGTLGGANIFGYNGTHGLALSGGSNNAVIRRNFFGIGADGVSVIGNTNSGLNVENSTGVTVGGTNTEDRNVIAGNSGTGLYFDVTADLSVLGNYIGTNGIGTATRLNGGNGIYLSNSANAEIGRIGAGNVIATVSSGTTIWPSGSTTGTIIANSLGVAANGTTALGTPYSGIYASDTAAMTIGDGTSAGANTIRNSVNGGVVVVGSAKMAITANKIFGNTGPGIDLGNNGQTGNDSGDPDGGPNETLNYPVINAFTANGTTTVGIDINVDVPSHANGYRIDFYKNSTFETFGEGETWVGFTTLAPGSNLQYQNTITLDSTVSSGDYISATLTKIISGTTYDFTSEFSATHTATLYTGPDGVEDTNFPTAYWDAQYYQGYNGISGSSWPSDSGLIFKGEAYWGEGDGNVVPIYPNGSGPQSRWSASENPTTPNNPHASYVGGAISGAEYQIDLRRKAPFTGTLEFGGDTNDVVDDAIEVFVNGTRQYAYFPNSPAAPDPRPSDSQVASIPVSANDDVLVRFINLGGIGGARFTYSFLEPDPLVVTSTADTNTLGTLRYAMSHANANAGADAITFNIAGAGPHVIALGSQLPVITDAGISIDGTTQSGASCGNLWAGTPHTLKIGIDTGGGSMVHVNVEGDDFSLRGVSLVNGASGWGALRVTGTADSTSLTCSYVGLNPDGTANGVGYGVEAYGSNTTIGGAGSDDGNVISSNIHAGILAYWGGTAVTIEGNFIGTDPTGASPRPNGQSGISNDLVQSTVTIAAIRKNLISGNTGHGIIFSGLSDANGSSGHLPIVGNYIGVDRLGTSALANSGDGINFGTSNTDGVTIGGTSTSDRNIISGNGSNGIRLSGIDNIDILGNYIGVDSTGLAALSNPASAITADNITGLSIGNGSAGGRNVSASSGLGFFLYGTNSTVAVNDNYFNTDTTGNSTIVTGQDGIVFSGTISTLDILGNVVGPVSQDKIEFYGNATGTDITIQGNKLGVGADGTTDIAGGTGLVGLRIWASYSAPTLEIGGAGGGEGNLIANNGDDGIYLTGTVSGTITGNTIYANGSDGVTLDTTAALAIYDNSIHSNTGLGIDLGNNGTTTNDGSDGDSGPNDLLNFPVVASITGDGTTSVPFDFTLDVPSNANGYRIDFFKNTLSETYGEGEIHLGAVDVIHSGGSLQFTGTLSANAAVTAGDFVSLTATRKTSGVTYDITSEFSATATAISAANALIVTSTADTFTLGTLRYAISHANGNTSDDAITFNITGAGPHTIALGSTLPGLTDPGTSIDGTTQSGAACGQLTTGTPHTLKIHLDLTSAGLGTKAFEISAANVTIKGLSITNAYSHAIKVNAGGDNFVLDCAYIGVEPDGVTKGSNAKDDGSNPAIRVTGITNATVRNSLISGNDDDSSDDGLRYEDITGGTIEGNIVGLNAAGTGAIGNGDEGILLDGTTSGVTIGGTTAATRNVVSANGGDGLKLDSVGTTTVLGNIIGLGRDGSTALGNTGPGINANGVTGLTIGNGASSGRNLISGNALDGIRLTGTATTLDINGNYIGVASDGATLRGNGTSSSHNGIQFVNNSSVVSDGAQIRNNVITGNRGYGINVNDAVTNLSLTGNKVGMDATGATMLSDSGAVYGEFTTGWTLTGNIIGSIYSNGVILNSGTATLQGNTIETGVNGSSALSLIGGGPYTIGGVGVGEGNTIAGGAGGFSAVLVLSGASATILGNTVRDSGQDGIQIFNSGSSAVIHSNTITNSGRGVNGGSGVSVGTGTTAAIYANSISGNDDLGIDIGGDGVTANDSGDGDTGSNDQLNYPLINQFTVDGSTSVSYDVTLDVPAHANGYRIEFFKNSAPDATNGEGEIYLGGVEVGGPNTYTGSFTALAAVAVNESISATTTRKTATGYDITSEFSVNATSFTANPAVLAAAKSVEVIEDGLVNGDDTVAIPGATLRYTITIRNDGAGAADADTTVIADQVPVNGSLKVDDFGGSLGVGPLGVTQGTPGSGLTYSYLSLGSSMDDLEFSDDDGTSWTYSPMDSGDGTDPGVTHIRIKPDGAFNANGGVPPSIVLKYEVVLF